MRIRYKDSFVKRFESQLEFIARDKPSAARKFRKDLLARIREIPDNPFLFRKSVYFDDDNIRDLIFKGYTVVFLINDDCIDVFGFVKYQSKVVD